MKSGLTKLGLVLLLAVATAGTASAQLKIGPHLGFDFDAEQLFLGASVIAPITVGENDLLASPSVEYVFIDYGTWLNINVDALYPLMEISERPFLVGAGLAIRYFSWDEIVNNPLVDNSDVDLGINLLGEMQFGGNGMEPFARARLTLGGGSSFGIMGGVRFGL